MSIIAKIKQMLGIGGVKVKLTAPSQVSKEAGFMEGKVGLTAKSDQHVITLTVKLVEEFTKGRGDDEETKEFDLGEIEIAKEFDIKAGEEQSFDFKLPFELLKTNADELAEKGGAMGALGRAARFANAEKSEYHCIAEADVKGTALDPDDKINVKLV